MALPSPPHDLLFAYDFPPMGGGIARWMEGVARAFPAGSLRVSTGAVDDGALHDQRLPNPVDRIAMPASRLRTLPGLVAWSRRGAVLARDPAARFAWAGTLRPAAWPAWWARRRTGLPYGVILHGGDLLVLAEKLARTPWKRATIRPLLDGAAVLVVNSRWTAARAEDLLDALRLPARADRVRVVAPGTDPALWSPAPEAVAAFRRRRDLPDGRWLVSVSRLVPHKGIDIALDAVAQLCQEFPSLRYAVVGQGPAREALQQHARDRGIADRVHFLDDVTDAELPAAYQLGEIFLGLSRQHAIDVEGFGIVFLEAAASGRPVVAGASGGVADAVDDGTTGLLVPPTDVPAVVAAVGRLLRDGDLARRMGEAGRERVRRAFTWARVADDFRALAAARGRQP